MKGRSIQADFIIQVFNCSELLLSPDFELDFDPIKEFAASVESTCICSLLFGFKLHKNIAISKLLRDCWVFSHCLSMQVRVPLCKTG